ncbi:hypothetical protein P7C71_g3307, partial [Lecanoromycetidae sp. Uapishka_2]
MREVCDPRTLWILTGVALRIAEGMGLHRDGAFLNLPPFETEMRRRIWWQLKLLDGDSAQLSGSEKKVRPSITDPRDPKFPSDINDDELYPGMSSPPVTTTERATDMVFCALRFVLRTYWTADSTKQGQLGLDDGLWKSKGLNAMNEKDKAIDEFEKTLESKYVRYCDPSHPLQLMASLAARNAVSTVRLIAHDPRRWSKEEQLSESERRYVWDLSIKGIKQYNMMHSSRELERFSWHAIFYFRWHALIHILDTLRVDPLVQGASQAWDLIDEVYETNPDFITNSKKALYVAVGNLCLKAYKAREAALTKEGKPVSATPSYVIALRQQREAANVRQKNRKGAVENVKHPIMAQSIPTDKHFTPHLTGKPPEQSQHLPRPIQTSQLQFTGSSQPELPSDSSAMWYSSHSDDQSNGLFTFTDDDANMDLDMLLAPEASMEDPSNQTIDWTQWDTLISSFT